MQQPFMPVAKDHRVSPRAVVALMHKAKRNPSFMREIMAKVAAKEEQREQIKKAVEVKNDFHYIIDSA